MSGVYDGELALYVRGTGKEDPPTQIKVSNRIRLVHKVYRCLCIDVQQRWKTACITWRP